MSTIYLFCCDENVESPLMMMTEEEEEEEVDG